MATGGIYRLVPYFTEGKSKPPVYLSMESINQPLSCRTETSNKDGFSVHSKIFTINDIRQITALVS